MSIAEQWGLPPDFQPVRFEIQENVKAVMRDVLNANEPVIVSITNRSGSITLLATPQRLFSVKTGNLSGAGVTGCQVKEYPWEGIDKLIAQQAADNLRVALHYRSSNGVTVETGRRAKMGRPAVDYLTPFEWDNGSLAFAAIYAVWEAKKSSEQ